MQKDTTSELYRKINQHLGSRHSWQTLQGYTSPYVLNEEENRFLTQNYIGIIRNFGLLCAHYVKTGGTDALGFEALLSHLNGQDSGRIRGISDKIFKQMDFPDQIAFLQHAHRIHGGLGQIISAYCMGIFDKLESNPVLSTDFTHLSGLEKNVLGDMLCQHLNTLFEQGQSKILTSGYAFQNLYSVCLNHQIRIKEENLEGIPEHAKKRELFDSVLSHFVDKVIISQRQDNPIRFDRANYMLKDFAQNFETLHGGDVFNTVQEVLKAKKAEKSNMLSGNNLFLAQLSEAGELFARQIQDIEKWEDSLKLMMDVRQKYAFRP